jgi:hypothetical protein
MKNKNNKLEPTFINIFKDQPSRGLSVKEIKDCYLETYKNETGLELDASALRKWLYRRIYKMLGRGELVKSYESGSSTAKYKMINKPRGLSVRSLDVSLPVQLCSRVIEGRESEMDMLYILKEKEAKYKFDLNTSIGESDEYRKLFESYPVLKTALIIEYEASRNKSSVLAGRLAATQKIITKLAH